MKMKEVCLRTGLTERSVRYYAGEGLISPASYEMNGRTYFDFSEADIRRLNEIAVLRKTGFSIEQISAILKNPGKIPEIAAALRAELERQREEIDGSLMALGALKAESAADMGALAAALQSLAEARALPAADLAPDFGRFDMQSREEKMRAYGEFLARAGRRDKRNRLAVLVCRAALLIFLSVFSTLLALGRLEGTDVAEKRSAAEYLTGSYEKGNVDVAFEDGAFSLAAEGLHGGTLRMTRIYSDGKKELSLSWAHFSQTENELVARAGLKTGRFYIERGLGNAVLMAILPDEKEGEYLAVYAESEDMTPEELLATVGGKVRVDCGWGAEYAP